MYEMRNREAECKIVIHETQDEKYSLNKSFENAYTSSIEYKKLLGSFMNTKDNNGQTALHIAASNNNLEGIKTLIEYGASLFIRDVNGKVIIIIIE